MASNTLPKIIPSLGPLASYNFPTLGLKRAPINVPGNIEKPANKLPVPFEFSKNIGIIN
nr:hypothetical protein [Lactococcus lactis]